MRWRGLAALGLAVLAACTSSAPPASPTGLPPSGDLGPPPPGPPTDGAIVTITAGGVSPKQVRVYEGSRVTFVNDDVAVHEMLSNPVHVHSDCPALNAVGFLVPGQSRASDPLTGTLPCGFHDHTREGDTLFDGTIFLDPHP